jgi:DNA repair exonuclease SbcCD ATPase subunit
MITKLELLNVKGITAAFDLQPCVAIIGPNFSGKTAILESIRLALLGWSPTHGKTAQGLFKLSSGKEMVIRAQVGDQKIERRWTQTGAKVSQSKGDELVPSVLVDLNTWLRMSAAERTSNLLAAATQSGTPDDTMARIRLLRVNGEAQKTALMEAKNRLDFLALDAKDHDANFAQFLDAAIEQEKRMLKDAKDNYKRLSSALQGGVMSQGDAPENVDHPLEASRAKLSEFDNRLGAHASQMRLRTKLDEEIRAIRADIRIDQVTINVIGASQKAKANLEKQIAELEKKAASLPDQNTLNLANEVVAQARVKSEHSTKAMLNAEKALSELKMATCCPHCLAKGKGWKSNLETNLREEISKRILQQNKFNEEFRVAFDHLKRLLFTIENCGSATTDLANRRQNLKDIMDVLEDAKSAPERIKVAQEKLAATEKELADLGPVESVDRLTDQAMQLRELIPVLEGQQKRYHGYMGERAAMAKQSERIQAIEAEVAVSEQVLDILVEDQKALLEQVADSVMARAREFTDGIMRGEFEWRDGEPGYERDGRWVSFDAFSGTEKAIAYAGLSVALAHESKYKVVLIDEMGVMDTMTKSVVTKRMQALVDSKFIDQFICADVEDMRLPPGYQVIRTEQFNAK